MLTAYALITLSAVLLVVALFVAALVTEPARPEAGHNNRLGGPVPVLAAEGQTDRGARIGSTEHGSVRPTPSAVSHAPAAEGAARGRVTRHVARAGSGRTYCGLPLERVDRWDLTVPARDGCTRCLAAAASRARQVA